MKMSIGVFSWNSRKLCDAVTEMEKSGDRIIGYEVAKLEGYPFEAHDKLVFLEYSPDILKAWKAKGDIGQAEIVIPEEPRKFGDPTPVDADNQTKRKSRRQESGE